jgi:hypothetical protein
VTLIQAGLGLLRPGSHGNVILVVLEQLRPRSRETESHQDDLSLASTRTRCLRETIWIWICFQREHGLEWCSAQAKEPRSYLALAKDLA